MAGQEPNKQGKQTTNEIIDAAKGISRQVEEIISAAKELSYGSVFTLISIG